jgi:hypothetical protein
LSLVELACLSGKWVAFEVYTPATLPVRQIAAIGPSAAACMSEIARSGRNPRQFEYVLF